MDALKYVSQILDDADSWETMMFLYDAALRQMTTKIDILNEEFIHIHNYNPIEHVKSRIKEPKSIVKKLKRHGHEVTLENMLKYITDIAGIRIICSFTQDIYRIADMLAKQSDLRVVELTDYITHPKVSGYRSYHMLVAVAVHLSDRVVDIIVEVQIFKGHDLYGRKYKENTKADRKCYRERKQDRNGSHLAAAAPVLFPYFVRNLFPAII